MGHRFRGYNSGVEYEARSVQEFCDAFRIGKTRFYNEVKSGDLAIIKIGRKTLITKESEEKWLELKKQAATGRCF